MRTISLAVGCMLFFAGASAMDSRNLLVPVVMILIGGLVMLLSVYMINGPQDRHPESHIANNSYRHYSRRR